MHIEDNPWRSCLIALKLLHHLRLVNVLAERWQLDVEYLLSPLRDVAVLAHLVRPQRQV